MFASLSGSDININIVRHIFSKFTSKTILNITNGDEDTSKGHTFAFWIDLNIPKKKELTFSQHSEKPSKHLMW